jgi:protein-L-isoaspartate(D-aspartate) O-methyltransferase
MDALAGVRATRPTRDDLVRVIASAGVRDKRLLAAFREVPRADFVPAKLAEQAYLDTPIPIPHDQVTTQPSLVARMVDALELEGTETVLEVGTGYGFQTALLGRLARFVWSVERWADLADPARTSLERHGIDNVHVVVGDGSAGLPERAPFDAVIVAAAYPNVPEPLIEQVSEGGTLVQPLGWGGREEVVLFTKAGEKLVRRRVITGAHFVRLRGRHGF